MPSGPEHYKAAEELLSQASFVASPNDPQPLTRDGHEMRHDVHHGLVDRAQVHATLAQAAATALSCPVDDQPPEDAKQWHKVAGSKPTPPPDDVVFAEILEDDGESEPKAAEDHSPALQDRYSPRKLYAWPCINHEIGLRIDNGAAIFVDAGELQRFIEQRAAGEPDEQPF